MNNEIESRVYLQVTRVTRVTTPPQNRDMIDRNISRADHSTNRIAVCDVTFG